MEPDFKEVERIIAAALAEDIGKGDATSERLIPTEAIATAVFAAREEMTVGGVILVPLVFAALDKAIRVTPLVKDGATVSGGTRLIEVEGPAGAILAGERVALNLLQRVSSVATLTARYVKEISGTRARILDTRKTMPGLRALDKYGVRCGGGHNHRMGLYDAILIKDNHVAVCGGIAQALARTEGASSLPVEIECDTLAQVQEALAAGAKHILLDNMDIPALREAVRVASGKAVLEASGNVRLENLRAIAETGVDAISVGRLTHSAPSVDIGLDIAITP